MKDITYKQLIKIQEIITQEFIDATFQWNIVKDEGIMTPARLNIWENYHEKFSNYFAIRRLINYDFLSQEIHNKRILELLDQIKNI